MKVGAKDWCQPHSWHHGSVSVYQGLSYVEVKSQSLPVSPASLARYKFPLLNGVFIDSHPHDDEVTKTSNSKGGKAVWVSVSELLVS